MKKSGEEVRVRNAIIHDYEKLQKKKLIEDIKKFTEVYKEYTSILIHRFVKET